MKRKINGFTLSETLIVVVVLGIIATLTIPALVNKNKESVAKTKVRKAMAAYESALNKMIIENDLKSDTALNEWVGATANCGNPSNYFKKVQGDGCIFKTSDGIWWNISDIERPVISFKEINAGNEEQITANANNANDKTAFVLVGRFGTDGSLRVDDLGYEIRHDYESSLAQVQKLYNFLSGKKSSGTEVTNCDEYDIICKYKRGDTLPECSAEKKFCIENQDNTQYIYDNHGNNVVILFTDSRSIEDDEDGIVTIRQHISKSEYIEYPDGSYSETEWSNEDGIYHKTGENIVYADGSTSWTAWAVNDNNVYIAQESISDSNGNSKSTDYGIDPNNNVYKTSETTHQNGRLLSSYRWSVDNNNNVYKSFEYICDGIECAYKEWSIDSEGNIYISNQGVDR